MVILEESNEFSERENVTEKLCNINHDLSLGISRKRNNIDETRSIFEDLLKSNEDETNTWNLDDDPLYVDKFNILFKKFVPSTDNDIPLNNVLKNNDENGSYVIEFFSEEKSLFEELNENEYMKICNLILEHLPIDLLFLKDRMFNVIFQFPITLFSVETRTSDDWDALELKLDGILYLMKKYPN